MLDRVNILMSNEAMGIPMPSISFLEFILANPRRSDIANARERALLAVIEKIEADLKKVL